MDRKSPLVLSALVVVLIATSWALSARDPAASAIPEPSSAGEGAGAEAATMLDPEACPAVPDEGGGLGDGVAAEPAAICRLLPQCSKDADCDALCGAGQGDCVRSRCPIRVCRCG